MDNRWLYDVGFLAFGIVLIVDGWALDRSAERDPEFRPESCLCSSCDLALEPAGTRGPMMPLATYADSEPAACLRTGRGLIRGLGRPGTPS